MSEFMNWLTDDLRIDEKDIHIIKYRLDEHKSLEILLRQIGNGKKVNWTAYVELKNSQYLSDSYLGFPSYREGDVIGTDTDREKRWEKPDMTLLTAIQTITNMIDLWLDATGGAK